MPTIDTRIDAYIARQREFAKPILTYLREVIHEGCPECEETLKWSSPSFMHHGILAGFAAFKEHATFGFWKHELVTGRRERGNAMGSFSRLTSVADLPPRRELVAMVRKAKAFNEDGARVPRRKPAPKKAIPVPSDLRTALARSKRAKATFDAFSPSQRREYLE